MPHPSSRNRPSTGPRHASPSGSRDLAAAKDLARRGGRSRSGAGSSWRPRVSLALLVLLRPGRTPCSGCPSAGWSSCFAIWPCAEPGGARRRAGPSAAGQAEPGGDGPARRAGVPRAGEPPDQPRPVRRARRRSTPTRSARRRSPRRPRPWPISRSSGPPTREDRWHRFTLCMQTPRDLLESFAGAGGRAGTGAAAVRDRPDLGLVDAPAAAPVRVRPLGGLGQDRQGHARRCRGPDRLRPADLRRDREPARTSRSPPRSSCARPASPRRRWRCCPTRTTGRSWRPCPRSWRRSSTGSRSATRRPGSTR